MKTKKLVLAMGILLIALGYFLLMQLGINKIIKDKTYNATNELVEYYCPNAEWRYVKAVAYDKQQFIVKIKVKLAEETVTKDLMFYYDEFF